MAQVILLKDVPQLGQKGAIKEVKDGYFRNFLMPRRLAELATPARTSSLRADEAKRKDKKDKFEKESRDELSRIGERALVFKVKTTPKGSLYRAFSEKEILEKLETEGFKTIKESWIKLEKPLKKTGEYEILIQAPFGPEARLKIEIK